MENKIINRKADINDLSSLKALEQECFSEVIRENFEFVLNSKSHMLFVSEISGKIVAYAGISISYEQGDILSVCVSKDFRRLGLAKSLLEMLFNKAKDLGVQTMFLEVEEDNLPAINLYVALGFKEISRRKNYYGDKTAIIMSKNL